jgi:hypothetical protein
VRLANAAYVGGWGLAGVHVARHAKGTELVDVATGTAPHAVGLDAALKRLHEHKDLRCITTAGLLPHVAPKLQHTICTVVTTAAAAELAASIPEGDRPLLAQLHSCGGKGASAVFTASPAWPALRLTDAEMRVAAAWQLDASLFPQHAYVDRLRRQQDAQAQADAKWDATKDRRERAAPACEQEAAAAGAALSALLAEGPATGSGGEHEEEEQPDGDAGVSPERRRQLKEAAAASTAAAAKRRRARRRTRWRPLCPRGCACHRTRTARAESPRTWGWTTRSRATARAGRARRRGTTRCATCSARD